MLHQTLEPGAILNQYVKSFWSVTRIFDATSKPVEIMPDSYRELVFSFAKPCVLVSDGHETVLPHVFGVNLLDKPLFVRAHGDLHIACVRLYPWATLNLFTTQQPVVDLSAQFGPLYQQLVERKLSSTPTALLEALRTDFSNQRNRFETDGRLLKACRQILLNNGVIDSAAITDAGCASERNLERMFKKLIGQTPKALARKVRFEFIRDFLWTFPDANLTSLAYDLDFSDLAHFSNEFRAFGGKSPTAFITEVYQAKSRN